jgi:hypothetical protein
VKEQAPSPRAWYKRLGTLVVALAGALTLFAGIATNVKTLANTAHQVWLSLWPGHSASDNRAAQQNGGPSTSPPVSAPSNVSAPTSSDREFVDESPEYITSLYEGRTELQAEALAQPYINKFIRVSGQVSSIVPSGAAAYVNLDDGHTGYSAFFDENWTSRLTALNVGETISVTGRILRVGRQHLWLEHCEFALTRGTPNDLAAALLAADR